MAAQIVSRLKMEGNNMAIGERIRFIRKPQRYDTEVHRLAGRRLLGTDSRYSYGAV